MAIRDRVKVDAMLGSDVARLIEQLGLRKEFEGGECHCDVCNDVVNYTNLKLLFPMADRKVGFLCNKPQCFVEFALKE
jgi:hypothetical protein